MGFQAVLGLILSLLLIVDGLFALILAPRLSSFVQSFFPGLNLRHLGAAEIAGGCLALSAFL